MVRGHHRTGSRVLSGRFMRIHLPPLPIASPPLPAPLPAPLHPAPLPAHLRPHPIAFFNNRRNSSPLKSSTCPSEVPPKHLLIPPLPHRTSHRHLRPAQPKRMTRRPNPHHRLPRRHIRPQRRHLRLRQGPPPDTHQQHIRLRQRPRQPRKIPLPFLRLDPRHPILLRQLPLRKRRQRCLRLILPLPNHHHQVRPPLPLRRPPRPREHPKQCPKSPSSPPASHKDTSHPTPPSAPDPCPSHTPSA